MKDELLYIGKKITNNHLILAQRVEGVLAEDDSEQSAVENRIPLKERLQYRAALMKCFGQILYMDKNVIEPEAEKWARKTAEISIQYGISLSDILREVATYRTVVWDVFTEELEQRKFAAITMLDVSKMIDPLINQVSKTISEVHEQHKNEMMETAYTVLEELSVPVVPVADGIAVVPLVGAIDTHRAKLVMEVTLTEGKRMDLSHMVIDVSGVPIIDTMVANQLFRVIKALSLTGIQSTLTGIRPEIAQTIVNLGIDLKELNPCVNLKQALRRLGLQLIKDTNTNRLPVSPEKHS
ncbi:STAS domain-containing protein [Bacillus thermotolerans]|uniref:STAS domain-containing protein n=1 Tax=Bacillus thermotolerans TaxID=1221996 RepID=UPI000580907A|nr:STAS domain-containing protein [Bacillus thermotolerans]KKB37174.1 RsbR, positive regulator of sigma-B [Bacillus thermotolerans]KKB42588.1 RsbR, positive regulator of sigma-B [Bacillus thermotolerans]